MKTRALALAVLLSAIGPAARAEQGSREVAREQYARGQELFRSGDYQGALGAFQRAYDAAPHPVVLKSLAECHERLGTYREAVRLLEQYLAERPEADDRLEVEERSAGHRSRPGTVRIVSDPPGAQVTLDGHRLDVTTPVTSELAPGDHAVAVELEGYQMVLEEFSVEFGGDRTLELRLLPIGAAPEPPTRVLPDGDPLGSGPTDVGEGPGGTGDAPLPPPSTVRVSTPVWIMTGLAGAGLLTGIISGSLALADQGDFDDGVEAGQPRDELQAIADSGQTKALVADIAFGVAAAAAITGIILFFVENSSREPSYGSGVSVTPSVAGDGGGVSATVRF